MPETPWWSLRRCMDSAQGRGGGDHARTASRAQGVSAGASSGGHVRGRIHNGSDVAWQIAVCGPVILETGGNEEEACKCTTLAPHSSVGIAYSLNTPDVELEREIFYRGMPFDGNGKIELARLIDRSTAPSIFSVSFGLVGSEVMFFRELVYYEPEPSVRLGDMVRFRTYLLQNGISLGCWCDPTMIKDNPGSHKDDPALAPVGISLLF